MNLGVVTLNLPRIALEAQGSQEKFWQILNERLAIVKDALVYRVERVKKLNQRMHRFYTCMVHLENV